jgi:protein-S-isoprenylcysteine O-methyltransferase Ste14
MACPGTLTPVTTGRLRRPGRVFELARGAPTTRVRYLKRSMTIPILPVAMLAIPALVREWMHWVTRWHQPKGNRVGGVVSVCIWIPCHFTLIALAFHAVVLAPVTSRGWIGYAIYWLAILLRTASRLALRSFYSPDVVIREGHKVIDNGPYKWIRHPLHTALILEMFGLWLISGVWPAIVLVLVSFMAHLIRSRREEDLLERYLGESYRRYRMRTWDALDLLPGKQKYSD